MDVTTFFFYSFTNFIISFFHFWQWHCHNCQNIFFFFNIFDNGVATIANIYIYIYIFTLSAMGLPQLPKYFFFFFFLHCRQWDCHNCQNNFFFFFTLLAMGLPQLPIYIYIYIYFFFFLHFRQCHCHN